jgi:hypothetical protein
MRKDIWYFIFAFGVLLFTWPILSIFRDSLPAYFFIIWLVYIVIIFVTSKSSDREDGGG